MLFLFCSPNFTPSDPGSLTPENFVMYLSQAPKEPQENRNRIWVLVQYRGSSRTTDFHGVPELFFPASVNRTHYLFVVFIVVVRDTPGSAWGTVQCWDQAQSLIHAKYMLYHLSHVPGVENCVFNDEWIEVMLCNFQTLTFDTLIIQRQSVGTGISSPPLVDNLPTQALHTAEPHRK